MATSVEVPESQRMIAVSLGKIASSRGQKGGINLHKNLLVATVLHKARTAYMIQHLKHRTVQPSPVVSAPNNVEMKEPTEATTTASSSVAAAPAFPSAPPSAGAPQSVDCPKSGSSHSAPPQQLPEPRDKENTPPPPPVSPECEKRLHQGSVNSETPLKDSNNETPLKDSNSETLLKDSNSGVKDNSTSLSRPSSPVTHAQQKSTRDYVSGGSSSCGSCVLKRRRPLERDNENVSAPKVLILDCKAAKKGLSADPAPMQTADSPQISNLVNIFSASFSGLSQVSSSSSSHKLSDGLTCAKEMSSGLDSVRQPWLLSV